VVLISPSSCAEVRILERLGARRQPATQAVTVLKRGRSSYSRQLPANTRRKQRICGDPSILGANCIKPTAASCTTRHLPPHIHSSEPHLSTSMLGGLYGSLPKAKEAEGGAGGAGGTGGTAVTAGTGLGAGGGWSAGAKGLLQPVMRKPTPSPTLSAPAAVLRAQKAAKPMPAARCRPTPSPRATTIRILGFRAPAARKEGSRAHTECVGGVA
jgi:hypothetical protein